MFVNQEYPWLHATPVSLCSCSCDCCGEGCGEIKCPYCLKDLDFQEYLTKQDDQGRPSILLSTPTATLYNWEKHALFHLTTCPVLNSQECQRTRCALCATKVHHLKGHQNSKSPQRPSMSDDTTKKA
ncbi:unnamed protein product, partial [Porites lobata]